MYKKLAKFISFTIFILKGCVNRKLVMMIAFLAKNM